MGCWREPSEAKVVVVEGDRESSFGVKKFNKQPPAGFWRVCGDYEVPKVNN